MDEPLLWLGTVAVALAAAGSLLPVRRHARLAMISAAMLLAPLLVLADNWNGERLLELRESPLLIAVALLLALVVLALTVRLLLAHPRWLPLLLIAAMPFRIPLELAGSSANLLIPLYGLLVAGLLAAWIEPERVLPGPPPGAGPLRLLGPLLAALVALYGLQAGYADDLSTAVENVGFFFVPFAALFLLLSAAPWDRPLLRAALIVLVVEGLLFAVVGFGQALVGELFWNEKVIDGNDAHAYFRVNSLFFDPNIMGRYLAVTMVLLAAVAAWGKSREAGAAALTFVVLLAALVLTFSQTSLLALLAGIGVLVAAALGIPRALAAGALALAAVAIAVFGLGGGGLTAETTGRTGLVSGGLELAADRPLAGYGSGSFADRFEQRFGAGDGIAVESHTEPVTFAAEQGAIGVLAYLALLGGSVVALWQAAGIGLGAARSTLAAALFACYVAMIVHSLGYAAFLTDPITWALLALAVALPALATASTPAPLPRAGPSPTDAAEAV